MRAQAEEGSAAPRDLRRVRSSSASSSWISRCRGSSRARSRRTTGSSSKEGGGSTRSRAPSARTASASRCGTTRSAPRSPPPRGPRRGSAWGSSATAGRSDRSSPPATPSPPAWRPRCAPRARPRRSTTWPGTGASSPRTTCCWSSSGTGRSISSSSRSATTTCGGARRRRGSASTATSRSTGSSSIGSRTGCLRASRRPFRAVVRRLRLADAIHLGPLRRWEYEDLALLPYQPFLRYLATVRWLPGPFESSMREDMTVAGDQRVALSDPPPALPPALHARQSRPRRDQDAGVGRSGCSSGAASRVLLYVEPVGPRERRVDRAPTAASLAARLASETGCLFVDQSWALDARRLHRLALALHARRQPAHRRGAGAGNPEPATDGDGADHRRTPCARSWSGRRSARS